jgi:type VI protein secretion system component Hcp
MFAQRRRIRIGALLLGVIAAAATTVPAADASARPLASKPFSAAALLLKLPPGTTKNPSAIRLNSYSFGASRNIGMPANAQPLTISKFTDSTSPIFLQHYASGAPFKGNTELDVVSAGGKVSTLITIVLENAVVFQYTPSGPGGPSTETISLNYEAVTYCWKPAPAPCTRWTKSHTPDHKRPR